MQIKMNILELSKINSTILSEEELINVLGGGVGDDADVLQPDTNSDKCNKCDKCTWFCG